MITLLSDDMLDFLLQINHIPVETADNYNSKVEKLKSADIIPRDDEYYSNKSEIPENNIRQISDGSPSIQHFFIDGDYTITGAAVPSCTYPNGLMYNGTTKISSTFVCNDTSQLFYKKNIVRIANTTRVSTITFNINNYSLHTSSGGTAFSGPYFIYGNKLYVDGTGYTDPLGIVSKNEKLKNVFELTPDGFYYYGYYLDENNKYQIYIIHRHIKNTS